MTNFVNNVDRNNYSRLEYKYHNTVKNMNFSIKDFFNKGDLICSFLQIQPQLLKEPFNEKNLLLRSGTCKGTYFILHYNDSLHFNEIFQNFFIFQKPISAQNSRYCLWCIFTVQLLHNKHLHFVIFSFLLTIIGNVFKM